MNEEADLFGHTPAQGSLFGAGEERMQAPRRRSDARPGDGAPSARDLVAKARAAERMPWSERDARMWQIVFPNMTRWLPDAEAEQLRFEFDREMQRLGRPGT